MMNEMRQAAAGNLGDSETVYPESMATEMGKRPIRLRATGLAPRIISHQQNPWNSSTPNPRFAAGRPQSKQRKTHLGITLHSMCPQISVGIDSRADQPPPAHRLPYAPKSMPV